MNRERRRHMEDYYLDPRRCSDFGRDNLRDRSPLRPSRSREHHYSPIYYSYPRGSQPTTHMPFHIPTHFDPPPPLLRYYDAVPSIDYSRSSRPDKRSYDRSVDEFLKRTAERRERDRGRRYRNRR
ncbi:hypothetical protein J437_LFUL013542 [Ladona fulva]|uniref:Uncharacterized protein n=1 Tax=Ladona fulva TaxID=123851 RepID=A0A8K0P567_LADFU|nr:hypothetical protein J437_LFUL013542 [Ladona fulva]